MEVSGQIHASGLSTPGEGAPGTHWIGGWEGPGTDLGATWRGGVPIPAES